MVKLITGKANEHWNRDSTEIERFVVRCRIQPQHKSFRKGHGQYEMFIIFSVPRRPQPLLWTLLSISIGIGFTSLKYSFKFLQNFVS